MEGRLQHKLLTENNINNILKSLPSYVSDYYYNIAVSIEPKTCEAYLKIIRKLNNFLIKNYPDCNLLMVDDTILAKYFFGLQRQFTVKNNRQVMINTSFSYQKTNWSALNNFYSYLFKKNYIPLNPLTIINRPKNEDKVSRYHLTKEDFKKILKVIETEKDSIWKYRNLAIMYLFMNTGMRKTALSEINIDDLNFEEHTLIVIDKRHIVHEYFMNEEMEKILKDWICQRNLLLPNLNDYDALFISAKYNRMSEKTIYNMVTKYTEKAIGLRLSPHKLRAAFCTILYDETKDAEFVRRAVGHKNIYTTSRYIVSGNNPKQKAVHIMESLLK